MIFIGDVHNKYAAYKRILKAHTDTIQVGDLGVGFMKLKHGERKYCSNPPHKLMKAGNHRFIRGNHDNPTVCRRHSQWIPDGDIENGMMFIGGAYSTDRAARVEGFDWWADEELSYAELTKLLDAYVLAKPRVMVTHDCPQDIGTAICHLARYGYRTTRTGQAFQTMWECHQPALWVFGHYHVSFDVKADGTRFVCLGELEARDLCP